jgi:hypothetical protein
VAPGFRAADCGWCMGCSNASPPSMPVTLSMVMNLLMVNGILLHAGWTY